VRARLGSGGTQTPTRGDLALGGSLLVVAVLSGLFIDAARPDTVEPSAWWHWMLIATPPVLVALRRIDPVMVTVVATVVQAAIWISDLPEVLLSMIVILYSAASEAGGRGLRVAVGASVVLTAVTAAGVRVADDVTIYQVPLIVLTCGTAIALGAYADRQRTVTAQLATEVAEIRLRSEYERGAAIADERNHIARELHDIIGHSLSTIAVRAEAADRVAENRPGAAHDAVRAIAAAARSSLTETRRVLAGLRESGDADLAPPPDVDAIRRMVADLAAAGVDVTLTTDRCDEHPPPAVVAGGAYRIVQESLTNAVRHAGATATIVVTLACRNGELDITVVDDGPGRASDGLDVTGSGLTGMAERAAILGGTFEADNRTAGGFEVHAVLPVDPASSPAVSIREVNP
jgi:signal transduction histidine kinase